MSFLPESFEASRANFRLGLAKVQAHWPAAQLHVHALPGEEDLSIDWITAQARRVAEKVLIITAGEHGIEGYPGAAMLQLFMEEYLSRLDPDTTGLLLVHAINPWGMKHHRHTNSSNVDLNRSFVTDFASLSGSNPDYGLLASLLEPTRPIKVIPWEMAVFFGQVVTALRRYGMVRLREASLRGQFDHPQGIYYGGQSLQEETGLMMSLFEKTVYGYTKAVVIDMHTGYGPRGKMTLVASTQEKMSSAEMVAKFNIPRVAATTPQEFYSIQGDMIEYLYTLMREKFPSKPFFAATFEFGTLGNSLLATVRSLNAIISENRFHWHGGSESAHRWVQAEYARQYAPPDADWLALARSDCRMAFEGLLNSYGFL